jgi:hypothetical protein
MTEQEQRENWKVLLDHRRSKQSDLTGDTDLTSE